jgi:hypothetical protein
MTDGHGGGKTLDLARLEAAMDSVRETCRQLLEENLELRADPSRPSGADPKRLRVLEARVDHLEAENRDLREHLDAATSQGGQSARDDLLANLYVANFQLHRTLELDAVLASIREILINLVGAERFVLYLLDPDGKHLFPVADESSRPTGSRRTPVGEGIMGVVAKTGIPYFDSDGRNGDFHNPLACVPMKVDGQIIGVIQVHCLFVQKTALTPQDHELFGLLAETAGTALVAATLRQNHGHPGPGRDLDWIGLLAPVLQATDGPAQDGGKVSATGASSVTGLPTGGRSN